MKKAYIALILSVAFLFANSLTAYADDNNGMGYSLRAQSTVFNCYYFVQKGDTLSKIAAMFDTTVSSILDANNGSQSGVVVKSDSDLLIINDIIVPVAYPVLPSKGRNLSSFIPKGWKVIAQADGDLNKDSLPDKAAVIEMSVPNDKVISLPRILLILFQNKDKTYTKSVQSNNAIMASGQGGIHGDPFYTRYHSNALSINRGSVVFEFYGGSNYRWNYIYRFRFQNGGWYMIGATSNFYYIFTLAGTYTDTNLLTGDQIQVVTDENRKETCYHSKIKVKPLVNLLDFDVVSEV